MSAEQYLPLSAAVREAPVKAITVAFKESSDRVTSKITSEQTLQNGIPCFVYPSLDRLHTVLLSPAR